MSCVPPLLPSPLVCIILMYSYILLLSPPMYTVTLPHWMRANLFLFPTLYVLVSLFNNPVQVYSERTVPSRSSSTTHSGKTPKTENSNLHGFELHRPLRKGTNLLIQVIKTIKNRYTEIVTRNLVKVRIPRPCSPIWDKWNDSSGQTPCPCPTCPTKIWRPPWFLRFIPFFEKHIWMKIFLQGTIMLEKV